MHFHLSFMKKANSHIKKKKEDRLPPLFQKSNLITIDIQVTLMIRLFDLNKRLIFKHTACFMHFFCIAVYNCQNFLLKFSTRKKSPMFFFGPGHFVLWQLNSGTSLVVVAFSVPAFSRRCCVFRSVFFFNWYM